MKTKIISALIMVAFSVSLSGCATVEDNKGAAVGGTLGAAAGVLLGGSTSGRIVGGLIGALVGGAIGHYAYDKQRSSEDTAKKYSYKASQGSVLTIENAYASPEVVSPGGIVSIKLTYAVLNPSSDQVTKLTETRELSHKEKMVGKPQIVVERKGGTYTSSIPVTLPKNADPGVYNVRTIVKSDTASDERSFKFTVR
ncbi:glycine zipper domain-containing protein [Thermodesulfobacteriota bacterium]